MSEHITNDGKFSKRIIDSKASLNNFQPKTFFIKDLCRAFFF